MQECAITGIFVRGGRDQGGTIYCDIANTEQDLEVSDAASEIVAKSKEVT